MLQCLQFDLLFCFSGTAEVERLQQKLRAANQMHGDSLHTSHQLSQMRQQLDRIRQEKQTADQDRQAMAVELSQAKAQAIALQQQLDAANERIQDVEKNVDQLEEQYQAHSTGKHCEVSASHTSTYVACI